MGIAESPTFALLLRRHRQATQMTQEELAEQAGLSVRAISDLERGVRYPRKDTVQMLLEALQLAPDERARLEAAAREGRDPFAQTVQAGRRLQPGSFLGALPPGPLVGRRQEQSRIQTAVESVRRGSGRLLLLTGEPGVGKTRLAQEASLEAQRCDFLVATGRCYEPEQAVPFYPMLEALAMAYRAAPPAIREEVPRRWPYLSWLLPDQNLSLPIPSSGGQEEQQWLFRAVGSFLQAIAEETPVGLLLDDLHWADDSSLKLLLYLARYTRGDRVLMVGTYRDVDVDRQHPLGRALVDLNRERLVERLVVRRLESRETATMIAATLGEAEVSTEFAELVHRYTNGNPFFIQEVLRALMERGDLYQESGRWVARDMQEIRAPESVRSTIGERLARLPAEAQAVLYEASVLGQSFSFEHLQQINQRRESEVEEVLEEAAAVGLVRELSGDDYAFNHALTRQALYEDLPARRRRRLHLAAAEALERSNGGSGYLLAGVPTPASHRNRHAGELTWHFIQGGAPERALPYALLAGEQAQQVFAYGEAERYFRLVLELGSTIPPSPAGAAEIRESPAELEALVKLGQVLNATERYDEALEALERAAELYRARGDLEQEGRIVAEIGWVHRGRGTAEEGIARIQPLVSAMETAGATGPQVQVLAGLYTALARLFFRLERHHEELKAAERASDLARRTGNDTILAVAEARRGAALMTLGQRTQAREVLEEAVVLAEATGNFGTMSVALDNLAELFRDGGDFHRSSTYLVRALRAAEQTGESASITWTFERSGGAGRSAWMLTRLGRITFLLGDWSAAQAHLGRAAELFRSVGLEWQATYPLVHLWNIQLLRGEEEAAAREHLESVVAAANPHRDVWIVRHVQRFLAELDLLEGRPRAALAHLQPLVDLAALDYPQALQLLLVLAQAHLELGNTSKAEQLLATCEERARAQNERLFLVDMLQAQGVLLTRQERWDEACRVFDEMLDIARSMSFPYGRARALYHSGMMRLEKGEPEQATEQLREALATFQRLGARPYVERTGQALSRAERT
jgi:tetratricopeptide (TPR) repeat protein